jgi:hypothetical protein
VIGIMLGGIVAMQVSLLKLNSGISRAVQTQSTLEKENMGLQQSIAALTSSDRVVSAAGGGQMVDPPAGDMRYVTARPATDPARAVRRMKPPGALQKAIMANHGMVPGALAPAGSPAAALAASLTAGTPGAAATGTPAAGTTTGATATATTSTVPPAATPVATPIATPTPVATVAATPPPVATVPGTGAATAPVG